MSRLINHKFLNKSYHVIIGLVVIFLLLIYTLDIRSLVKTTFDFKDQSDLDISVNRTDSLQTLLEIDRLRIEELEGNLNKSLNKITKTETIINEIPTYFDNRYIIADSSDLTSVIKHLRGAKPEPRDDYIRDSLSVGLRD